MKTLLIIGAILVSQLSSAQDPEIKKAVQQFFTAFHAKDSAALRKTFAKEIVLHSISDKNSEAKVSVEQASVFLQSIAAIPPDMKFEEKLLSFRIDQDGLMAHVWTPYEFYINGKMSHSGVNSFSLVKEKGNWKILYCVDTRRRP